MTDLIPAAPGWYLQETDGDEVMLDPIIAWKPATDADGDDVLLPYVSGGSLVPPMLMTVDSFGHYGRTCVYRPSHIPEDEAAYRAAATAADEAHSRHQAERAGGRHP